MKRICYAPATLLLLAVSMEVRAQVSTAAQVTPAALAQSRPSQLSVAPPAKRPLDEVPHMYTEPRVTFIPAPPIVWRPCPKEMGAFTLPDRWSPRR
jgi:hypothetical protein